MPFTREQQREHYLKNQELLKAKRRERYLANKNQVEQITVTKVEQFSQVEQNHLSKVEQSQVEQLLAKNVQPREKVEQNLKVEQINTTKEKVVDKINNSVVDIQAFNEEVFKRAGTINKGFDKILAIDPSGTGTTGICLINNKTIEFKEFKDIYWRNHYDFIVSSIKLYNPNLLLFENTNFISNRTSDSLNLIRLLGAIECLAVNEVKSINVVKVKQLSKELFKGTRTIKDLQYLPGRGKGWMFNEKRVSIHQLEAFIVYYLFSNKW